VPETISLSLDNVPDGWYSIIQGPSEWTYPAFTSGLVYIEVLVPEDSNSGTYPISFSVSAISPSVSEPPIQVSSTLNVNVVELVLDQSQTHTTQVFSSGGLSFMIYEELSVAQSFVPSISRISRLDLRISFFGRPTDKLRISIRSSPHGNPLASTEVNYWMLASGWGEKDSWYKWRLENDLDVTPGETYFIVLETNSNAEQGSYQWYTAYGLISDAYPQGSLYWSTIDGWRTFIILKADATFRTYGY